MFIMQECYWNTSQPFYTWLSGSTRDMMLPSICYRLLNFGSISVQRLANESRFILYEFWEHNNVWKKYVFARITADLPFLNESQFFSAQLDVAERKSSSRTAHLRAEGKKKQIT